MAFRKGKSVSFDTMVKIFMRNYDIPTKKDMRKLIERIDRLEKVIKKSSRVTSKSSDVFSIPSKTKQLDGSVSASDMVLDIIKSSKKGAGFADIQSKVGFNDKKLRNIIFRLNKIKKIVRKSRGLYVAA